MYRVNPTRFYGPRAYFTDFDYRIVRTKSNREAYRRQMERKLKVLLLTKDTVVCAVSHLIHPFSYGFFKNNPILLNKGMILPALRKDKGSVEDYIQVARLKRSIKREMSSFYNNHVSEVVSWKLIENSSWFQQTMLKELRNPNSVIRRNLIDLDENTLGEIVRNIEEQKTLGRGDIIRIISKLPRREKRILFNFANLIYHMSGARVVNCESALPQENYIDYSLADIKKRQIILSELQIFWKIFLELAFETILRSNIPIELLDQLTFENVYHIRKPIEESSFRVKYDALLQKAVSSINKDHGEELLFDINELIEIRKEVADRFHEIFEKELPKIRKRKHLENVKNLSKSSVSMGIAAADFIPIISPVASLASMAQESPELIVNVNRTLRSMKAVNNHNIYLENKKRALYDTIEKSSFSNKAELLEVVDYLMEIISAKLRF